MTAAEIRQSFLNFFREKEHTVVPSAPLLPSSPNLLFTNAGMNQFVPYFLGTETPPYRPARAADTQKCIRAGGKHNDLDDVGLDTYHHTFFEMLGNWSFGDYFKREAIAWAWELVVGRWRFPANRLYATIYQPGPGDPSERDTEAYDEWAKHFVAAGLDPAVHIVDGNKKDNFWMMGDTGPCGPCSELHVDLTPAGDTRGSLVNKGDARCIEIWNLVFIQFNAEPDGGFRPLPARHVDTGMGFERVCSIIQGTKNFTDFTSTISNYDTDVFAPIFRRIAELSGKHYASTLPAPGAGGGATEQEKTDVAFRVVGDHLRTLCFSIADGIIPSNNDRGYVLRRILRRAMRYGRHLGLGGKDTPSFLAELADSVLYAFGPKFPELIKNRERIRSTLSKEEAAFVQNLDRGLKLFKSRFLPSAIDRLAQEQGLRLSFSNMEDFEPGVTWPGGNTTVAATLYQGEELKQVLTHLSEWQYHLVGKPSISGEDAFDLSSTYGFPIEETLDIAREYGLSVDIVRFESLAEQDRALSRAARKTEVVAAEGNETEGDAQTEFVGYEHDRCDGHVLALRTTDKGETFAVVDRSPFYAEMGGQVGDTGTLRFATGQGAVSGPGSARAPRADSGASPESRGAVSPPPIGPSGGAPAGAREARALPGVAVPVLNTVKRGGVYLLKLGGGIEPAVQLPQPAVFQVESPRRRAIEAHHSATHLLHWALHEVVGPDAAQKGSYVGPDRLRFDFNSAALTPAQVADVERLVNEHALTNVPVSWREVPYADIRGRTDVMQFFGDKYGELVRVVQIGGRPGELDGFSMELCAGTHVRATGQLGAFKVVSEGAIAAGVRRIEAVAGRAAVEFFQKRDAEQGAKLRELEAKVLELNKALERERVGVLKREAAARAAELLAGVDAGAAVPRLLAKVAARRGREQRGAAAGLGRRAEGARVPRRLGARRYQRWDDGQQRVAARGGDGGVRREVPRGQTARPVGPARRRQGRRPAGPRARRRPGAESGGCAARAGGGAAGVRKGDGSWDLAACAKGVSAFLTGWQDRRDEQDKGR